MAEARNQLEHSRAHYAYTCAFWQRAAKKWYEKNRLLENAIRDTVKVGELIDTDELLALLSRVPKKPRKKWGWR